MLASDSAFFDWKLDEDGCWNIRGRDCLIFMQPRPAYCDRGRWLANLDCYGNFALEVDVCDGWPRYYFDLERGKAEIEAWLICRRQAIATHPPKENSPAGDSPS